MKLAMWMPNPESERQKLTILQSFVTLASNVGLFKQLRDKEKYTATVYETVHRAHGSIKSAGAIVKVVLDSTINPDRAAPFRTWCEGFGVLIEAAAEEATMVADKLVRDRTATLSKVCIATNITSAPLLYRL